MAKLVVVSPALAGLCHELGGEWITIGRADVNTFQIVESSISGRHCEVQLQGDEVLVRDLLSTNGTFVQNRKVSEAVLKSGQTLRLGNVELQLEPSVVLIPQSKPVKTKITSKLDVASAGMPPIPKTVANVQKDMTADSAKNIMYFS